MTRRTAVQAEKELRDNARLLRWWKAWHREQREAVLAGPHGRVNLSSILPLAASERCTLHSYSSVNSLAATLLMPGVPDESRTP